VEPAAPLMSATILYRHPARPDETWIALVPDAAYAAALKDQLVKRGFQIVKIVSAPARRAEGDADAPTFLSPLGNEP
jgi:hypothetical protein